MDGIGVDVQGLKDLASQLRSADKAFASELRVGLKEAGTIVATEAKSRAGWSSRIPGSITVRSTPTSVKVVAGGPNAPHAAAYEGGPAGAGTFRHPVFGHDTWVTEPTRPYLAAAGDARGDDIDAAVGKAIDRVVASLGFR